MKPWTRISASQMKTATLCARKWWFERISDLPPAPPSKSMLLGSAIHKEVELWIKRGEQPVDLRAKALADCYPRTPLLVSSLLSEVEVNLQGLSVPLLGYIDLVDLRGLHETLEVVDFKTLSNWKWAKTELELASDLQMIPYAFWAFRHYEPNSVSVTHLQVHTSTSVVGSATAKLTRDMVTQTWTDTLVPLSDRMAGWAQKDTPNDVPATLSACSAFGGCPYLSVCNRGAPQSPFSAISRVKSSSLTPTGDTMSSLQELLRARSAARAAAPAPQPVVEVAPAAPLFAVAQPVVEVVAPVVVAPVVVAPSPVKSIREADYPAAAAAIVLASKGRSHIPAKELKQLVGNALQLERVAWARVVASCAAGVPGDLTLMGLDIVPAATFDAFCDIVKPLDKVPHWEQVGQHRTLAPVLEAPTFYERGQQLVVTLPVVEVAPTFYERGQPLVVTLPVVEVAPVVEVPVVEVPVVVVEAGYHLLIDIGVVQAPSGWSTQTLEAYLAPIIARLEKSTGGPAFLRDFRAGERTVAHMASLDLPKSGTMLLVDSANSAWKELSQALVPHAACILRGSR